MKKIFFLAVILSSALSAISQNEISIIPEPVKLTRNDGKFVWPPKICINADQHPGLKQAIADLTARLTIPTGYHVELVNSQSATITLRLNKNAVPELGNEGYQLNVTSKQVTITANQPAGIFYGVQSFLQL